jgi:hypothetical protein
MCDRDRTCDPYHVKVVLGLAPRQIQFDHRTKPERLATILLPNSVADDGTKRYETSLSPPIRQQNSTVQNAH